MQARARSRSRSRVSNSKLVQNNKFKLSPTWLDISTTYSLNNLIGQGSFGEVVSGKHIATGKDVAIKLIRGLFDHPRKTRAIVSEIQVMSQLSRMENNQHTVKILDIIVSDDDCIFIVMEKVISDLKKVLLSSSGISFDEEHALVLMYNSLCSLNYLHSSNIMHRDIKPANLLVDGNCQVKLCDFGFARTVPINTDAVTVKKIVTRPHRRPT